MQSEAQPISPLNVSNDIRSVSPVRADRRLILKQTSPTKIGRSQTSDICTASILRKMKTFLTDCTVSEAVVFWKAVDRIKAKHRSDRVLNEIEAFLSECSTEETQVFWAAYDELKTVQHPPELPIYF